MNGLSAPKSGAVGQWNVAETSERAAISELWEIKEEIQFRVTSELKNTLNCLVAIFAVQEARGRHFDLLFQKETLKYSEVDVYPT